MTMRIDLNATVVDSGGDTIGRLHEIIFELDSRRAAGFLVVVEGVAPREVQVMVGQVAEVEEDRISLTLSGEEVAALPDAYQHLYVAPNQDLEAEIDEADGTAGAAMLPDPGERPTPSAIPGIALMPNLFIPIEVERSVVGDDQIALGTDLRVLKADGAEVGRLGGVIVNDEAQLISLVLAGGEGRTIDYSLIDTVDDDANELTLLPDDPDDMSGDGEFDAEGVAIVATDDADEEREGR